MPELKAVSNEWIHDPWNMSKSVQKQCGVTIDTDYPAPIECAKYTSADATDKQNKQAKRGKTTKTRQTKLHVMTK